MPIELIGCLLMQGSECISLIHVFETWSPMQQDWVMEHLWDDSVPGFCPHEWLAGYLRRKDSNNIRQVCPFSTDALCHVVIIGSVFKRYKESTDVLPQHFSIWPGWPQTPNIILAVFKLEILSLDFCSTVITGTWFYLGPYTLSWFFINCPIYDIHL